MATHVHTHTHTGMLKGGQNLKHKACDCGQPGLDVQYNLKFSQSKYFAGLPNCVQKQIFSDKIFVVQLPAMPHICYELDILWEKFFMAVL